MHAVIFEVWPKEEGRQEYLDIAAALRPTLEQMDGFMSIERFQSLTDPGKILSLSFWRDDAAIVAWRQVESHRTACRAKPAAELSSATTACGSPESSATTGCRTAPRLRLTAKRGTDEQSRSRGRATQYRHSGMPRSGRPGTHEHGHFQQYWTVDAIGFGVRVPWFRARCCAAPRNDSC